MTSASDYFGAARDLMADGDPSRVTIEALCGRVGTTSGSFYHHFGSFDGFVEALAADWVEQVLGAIGAVTIDAPPEVASVRKLVDGQLERQPHHQEAAFRGWARTNERVRAAVEQVDMARREVSIALVRQIGPELDDETATACGELANLAVIGAQTHNPDTAPAVAARLLSVLASLIDRVGAEADR